MTFTVGFLPHTQTGNPFGQVHPLAISAKVCLTMRSSNEWKVMTAMRPPGFSRPRADSSAGRITSSSELTSMRMAWKERFAG